MNRARAALRYACEYGRRIVLPLVFGLLAAGRRAVLRDDHRADHRSGALRARRRDRARCRGFEHVGEDALGRPETVTRIAPLAVLKGRVAGDLVLHQLGGTLPDGRFFKLWGRPEYQPGHEVIVFAIARPEGDYQTAELLLGKFEVQQDEQGRSFAVPALAADAPGQVTVTSAVPATRRATVAPTFAMLAPRELGGFLLSLRSLDRHRAVGLARAARDADLDRAPGIRFAADRPQVGQHRRPLALEQWGDGGVDAGRPGQHHRRRNRGGDQRHRDLGCAARIRRSTTRSAPVGRTRST